MFEVKHLGGVELRAENTVTYFMTAKINTRESVWETYYVIESDMTPSHVGHNFSELTLSHVGHQTNLKCQSYIACQDQKMKFKSLKIYNT